MHLPFLQDLFLVLVVGAAAAWLFERFRLPVLVGFLLTGVIVGPRGLGMVAEAHHIDVLAEIGVIALLFTIGVELSLGRLMQIWRVVLGGGGAQVALTSLAGMGAALLFGLPAGPSLFVGFVVAMSSTAIVMRLLSERAETASPHGNFSLAILVFQDLVVVPMVLLVPILAGQQEGGSSIGITMLKAAGVVAATLLVARRVVPFLLARVVATRSREAFLLTLLALGLGTAWATSQVGLSLGLGAFLAGLVVSESEYGHHALSLTVPFRDTFSALFFVSIGMLFDLSFVATHLPQVLSVTAAVLVGKTLIVGFIVKVLLRYPLRIGLLTGLLLSQIGEFSFVLLHEGLSHEILPSSLHNLLLAATGLSMAAAPLVLRIAPGLARKAAAMVQPASSAADHAGDGQVLIVGHGVTGRNVARALQHAGVSYMILEMNPRTVRTRVKEGEHIAYGDATQPDALLHAGADRARAIVITVPDPASTRQIVRIVRDLNQGAHLIVRTRFVSEVSVLGKLGADEVVPEEFETSLEILSRVLRTFLVPRETIDTVTREIRAGEYEMLRAFDAPRTGLQSAAHFLPDVQMEIFQVADDSPIAQASLGTSGIKQEDGTLIVAIRRGAALTPNPPADWCFQTGDAALAIGSPSALAKTAQRFRKASRG